jgi:hypothetical protein
MTLGNISRKEAKFKRGNILKKVSAMIAQQVATLGLERLILGVAQNSLVNKALRGDVKRMVSELLPEEIQLIIHRT